MTAPWFFQRLSIVPTRDARQIRRAYALALKSIDQETEREAFETLRKAYEAALAWASTPGGTVDPIQPPAPAVIDAPAPPRVAATVISNESYGASRLAVRQWIGRLFKPRGMPLGEIFDQAFDDPRLVHVDSRVQLEAQLIEALYRESADQLRLFLLAAARFGWGERNARPAAPSHQAEWIHRVINQQLARESLAPDMLAAQQAAIEAARASDAPTRPLAFQHAPALCEFNDGFPELAELSLPAGRVGAWKLAYDRLPEGWLRAARLRQRFQPSLSRIAATAALLIVVGSLLYGMIRPMFADDAHAQPSQASTPSAAVATPSGAAGEAVLAYEFTGPVTRDSCEAAHAFMHESNWLDTGDADAIALLSTRAFLCQDRTLWPQARDPLLDCLRAERGAAFSAARPELPTHCKSPVASK